MSFVRNLFAPKVKTPKQDYRFADQTTKLVGKPLPVIYGSALVRGNIVRASTTADLKFADHIIALCWGPVDLNEASCNVNGKRPKAIDEIPTNAPDQVDVKVYLRDGHLGQAPIWFNGDNTATTPPPNATFVPAYGLNRVAYARVRGRASQTYGGFDQIEVVATRPPLFMPTGSSAEYGTPIPSQIAAVFPGGIPSYNPIAAALDYLLNTEYGPGRPVSSFGDFSTWIAAIARSAQGVLVPGFGGEERHIIGIAIGDAGETHNDVVETLLELGDAKPFESGGVIKVWQPGPGRSPVAALTRDDFEPTGVEYQDLREKPNIVEIQYDDALNSTDKQMITWMDQDSIDRYGEIRRTITYRGLARRSIASRKARLIGRTAIAESIMIEGNAHHRYRRLEPGDFVTVTMGDESGEWVQNQPCWVDEVERINTDSEYGIRLSLVVYGGDALYDDGMASELDSNDPILSTPHTGLPDPRGEPLPVANVAGAVSQFADQDGRVSYVVTLRWPEPTGEPSYMHDRYNIYRRQNLGDPWVAIGSTVTPIFRDVGAPVYAGDVYYAVVSITSAQNEGALPALFSVKVDRITGPIPVDPNTITVTAGNTILLGFGLVYFLNVSWQAVPGAVKYQVYYKLNGGANIFVQEITGTSLRIDQGIVPGSYLITVVAIGSNGQPSQISSKTFVLTDNAYDGPEPVTNLAVAGYAGSAPGQFIGRDIVLTWQGPPSADFPNPRFKDYAVEVLLGTTTVDVVYVNEPRFLYDYERNWKNNLGAFGFNYGARAVTFRVRTRDRADRMSSAAQITATNPQAPVPATVEVNPVFKTAVIKVVLPTGVPDLAGCLIAIGTSATFTPTAGNISYDLVVAPGAGSVLATITTVPGTTVYIKAGLYDGFGKDNINWSSGYKLESNKLIGDEIATAAIRAEHIADDVFNGIEGRIGNNGVLVVSSLPSLPDEPDPETGNRTYFVGRVVFLITDGKLYRNKHEVWTREVDGGDIKADSILAGALTVGAVSADNIGVNQIIAKHLAIGDFSNICRDPIFADPGYWYIDAAATMTPEFLSSSSARALGGCPAASEVRINANQTNGGYCGVFMHLVQVEPGESYYLSCFVGNGPLAARQKYITAVFYDINNSVIGFASVPAGAMSTGTAGLWTRIENIVVAPTNAWRMRAFVAVGPGVNASAHFTLFRCRKMANSVLIEDGAITAFKVAALQINAGHIAAQQINGFHMAIDSIDAIHIRAQAIETDALQVNAVTTPKVTPGAISAVVSAGVPGYSQTSNNETMVGTRDLISYTTDPNGTGVVLLSICSLSSRADYIASVHAQQRDDVRAEVHIRRSTGVKVWGDQQFSDNGAFDVTIPRTIMIRDNPGAGVTVTYQIYFYAFADDSAGRQHSVSITPTLVTIQELKR